MKTLWIAMVLLALVVFGCAKSEPQTTQIVDDAAATNLEQTFDDSFPDESADVTSDLDSLDSDLSLS